MMDCRVRRREIEEERRGEGGKEGRQEEEEEEDQEEEDGGREIKDIKESVRRKVREMGGGEIFGKRVNKVKRERRRPRERERERERKRERERERDEGSSRQQSEFIFINGQRAERELLKRRKMNERMSVNEGGGDEGRCDVCPLPAF